MEGWNGLGCLSEMGIYSRTYSSCLDGIYLFYIQVVNFLDYTVCFLVTIYGFFVVLLYFDIQYFISELLLIHQFLSIVGCAPPPPVSPSLVSP